MCYSEIYHIAYSDTRSTARVALLLVQIMPGSVSDPNGGTGWLMYQGSQR